MAAVKKHVAITGASSGIGDALARELGRAGYRVTLVARRKDLMERLAKEIGGETFIAPCDLSEPARATEWIPVAVEALGPIDVMINNAGIQLIGRTLEIGVERSEAMLNVNLLSPLRITHAVLPGMIRRGQGTIVDVASVAGLAPTPFMTYYNASKGGLAAASESLRGELRGTGVHVVTVYPGPIDTPMGAAGVAAYENTAMVTSVPFGTAPRLARLVRLAIERRSARVIYPRLYHLTRWFPGFTRYFLDRFTPPPRSLTGGSAP